MVRNRIGGSAKKIVKFVFNERRSKQKFTFTVAKWYVLKKYIRGLTNDFGQYNFLRVDN